jgi:hypothetical protein
MRVCFLGRRRILRPQLLARFMGMSTDGAALRTQAMRRSSRIRSIIIINWSHHVIFSVWEIFVQRRVPVVGHVVQAIPEAAEMDQSGTLAAWGCQPAEYAKGILRVDLQFLDAQLEFLLGWCGPAVAEQHSLSRLLGCRIISNGRAFRLEP